MRKLKYLGEYIIYIISPLRNRNSFILPLILFLSFALLEHKIIPIYSKFFLIDGTPPLNLFKEYAILFSFLIFLILDFLRHRPPRHTPPIGYFDILILLLTLYLVFRPEDKSQSQFYFVQFNHSLHILRFQHLIFGFYVARYLINPIFYYRDYSNKFEKKKSLLDTDSPIKCEKEDELGQGLFIDSIFDHIKHLEGQSSFAIGLEGHWGIGKTSVLNLLEERISEERNLKLIKFQPWIYNDFDSLLKDFFRTLESEIPQLEKPFGRYYNIIIKGEKTFLNTDFLASVLGENLEPDKIKNRIDTQLDLNPYYEKYIIYMDDIDRLTSSEINSVLRLIRAIANFKNFVYLVPYDHSYIINALESSVPKAICSEQKSLKNFSYLDKIFQLRLSLPEPEPERVKAFLFKKINEKVDSIFLNKRKQYDLSIDEAFTDEYIKRVENGNELIPQIIGDIRTAKRFLNTFFFRYEQVSSSVNFYDLFHIECLNFIYPDTYRYIKKNKEKFTTIQAVKFDDVKSEIPDQKEQVIKLVRNLFFEFAPSRKYAIYREGNFDRYFYRDLTIHLETEQEYEAVKQLDDYKKLSTEIAKWIPNKEEAIAHLIHEDGDFWNSSNVALWIKATIKAYEKVYNNVNDIPGEIEKTIPGRLFKFFKNGKTLPAEIERLLSELINEVDLVYLSYFHYSFITWNVFNKETARKFQLGLLDVAIERELNTESILYIIGKAGWFGYGITPDNNQFINQVWKHSIRTSFLASRLDDIYNIILTKSRDKHDFKNAYSADLATSLLNYYFKKRTALEKNDFLRDAESVASKILFFWEEASKNDVDDYFLFDYHLLKFIYEVIDRVKDRSSTAREGELTFYEIISIPDGEKNLAELREYVQEEIEKNFNQPEQLHTLKNINKLIGEESPVSRYIRTDREKLRKKFEDTALERDDGENTSDMVAEAQHRADEKYQELEYEFKADIENLDGLIDKLIRSSV